VWEARARAVALAGGAGTARDAVFALVGFNRQHDSLTGPPDSVRLRLDPHVALGDRFDAADLDVAYADTIALYVAASHATWDETFEHYQVSLNAEFPGFSSASVTEAISLGLDGNR
jgi:hypothetical protein